MGSYPYFTEESKRAYAVVDLDLRQVYFERCHNCQKALEEFECQRRNTNYGRRFVKCPNYQLPVHDDGATMLPYLTNHHQGPDVCVFRWLNEVYPQRTRKCIEEVIGKLERAEAFIELLKEHLLLQDKKKGDGDNL